MLWYFELGFLRVPLTRGDDPELEEFMKARQYDKVKISDGTVGILVEDFGDGWFLLEYELPDDPIAMKEVEQGQIVEVLQEAFD